MKNLTRIAYNKTQIKGGYMKNILILMLIAIVAFAGCSKKDVLTSETDVINLLTPSNPNPVDGSVNQPTAANLSWISTGSSVTFSVYLEDNPDIKTVIAANLVSTTFSINNLISGKTYYWKVIASDNKGNIVTGPVWTFSVK